MRQLMWLSVALLMLLPRTALGDEWWGRDKALHFTLSIGISGAGYLIATPLTAHREQRVIAGAGIALTLGAAKEGYDALGHGDPSWRDFAWDVAGTAVGVMIAYAVDCIVSDSPRSAQRTAVVGTPLNIDF